MRVLIYNELQPDLIDGFDKVFHALESGNFTQADVRKVDDNLYRARLNRSDRLLFTLRKVQGETCCLLLEHIPNHEYNKSRFLRRAATVDEARIPPITDPESVAPESAYHINPNKQRFNILDKVITFDDDQELIYSLNPPLIMVGSAGSGKTAVALEKIKPIEGSVLYISLSPYLVRHAHSLYYSFGYYNNNQSVDFLSFAEFLEYINVPRGEEITPCKFKEWFYRQTESRSLQDPYKVFEELRGVICGQVTKSPWLDRTSYLNLGVKQSIFTPELRNTVYDLFEKYLRFLANEGIYDPIILSHKYLSLVEQAYDCIVVDELQDMTSIQLLLILKSLRRRGNFLLCGDANQIVHPNHFSWSQIKSLLLYEQQIVSPDGSIKVLHNNYRNSMRITEMANRVLILKQLRFGSLDRESNHLLFSTGKSSGNLQLLENSDSVRQALNDLTSLSARVAVIVMHQEQKRAAREHFSTPLIFSVQEAKGLEYDSVIIYNFISEEREIFNTIGAGVNPSDVEAERISFARPKDKHDKSLDAYKFYINALYVGITRAIKNIYWIESDQEHVMLRLLGLTQHTDNEVAASKEESPLKTWRSEAERLELQGKTEQAREIRDKVLCPAKPPWRTITRTDFDNLRERVFKERINKDRLLLFEYALLHSHLPTLSALARERFGPAAQDTLEAFRQLYRNNFMNYGAKNFQSVIKQTEKYGIDHRTYYNLTPLMIASRTGNPQLLEELLRLGADPQMIADNGYTALHFALEQAYLDASFCAAKLASLYQLLVPLNLSIQVNRRLIKLDRQQMEFFLFSWLSALFYHGLGPLIGKGESGFSPDWIAATLHNIPHEILPPSCKDPAFISGVLHSNEFRRSADTSFQLFRRTSSNSYVINPGVLVRANGQWRPYYDLFKPQDLDPGITPALVHKEATNAPKRHGQQNTNGPAELEHIHKQRDQRVGIFRSWLLEQTRTWTAH